MKRILIYLIALTLLPQAVSAAVLVGKTEGSFSVSPSGAATYTIPIKVQNGLSDFSPSISLTYSSQAGNGIAGMGFSISGLSAISIVPRNVYFDGKAEAIYTGEDNAFALDGQRLLLKEGQNGQTGAIYRTENEQYNLISIISSANGTPATFQVKTTNGSTYKYGNSSGRLTLSNGEAYQWALDYAEDVLGNYIQYTYAQEGVLYPTSITYGRNIHGTAGVDCTILFNYESRPDSVPAFLHGEQCFLKKRLKSIVCKYSGNIYRTYTLNYTEDVFSHLISVSETGTSSASVPPTTFEWEVPSEFRLDCSSRSMAKYALEDEEKEEFFSGDLDGDGITEVISMEVKSANPRLPEESSPKRTYITGRKWNPDTQKFEICFDADTWALTPIIFTKIRSGGLLMHVSHNKGNSLVLPYCNISDGEKALIFKFVKEGTSYNVPLKGHSDDKEDFPLYMFSDTDKDGLDNIFVIEKEKKNEKYPAYMVTLNLTTGYNQLTEMNLSLEGVPDKIRCADFNSDGMTDLLISTSEGYYIYWNRNGTFSDEDRYYSTAFKKCDIIQLGDFNGDGLVDLIINKSDPYEGTIFESDSSEWFIAKNTGNTANGFFVLDGISYLSQVGAKKFGDDRFYCIVQDFNGDGKSDVVVAWPIVVPPSSSGFPLRGRMCFLLSNGQTLSCTLDHIFDNYSQFPNHNHIVQGLFDGQGEVQILYKGKSLSQDATGWHILENPSIKVSSQKIISVTDGLGATDSISYGLLTDKDVYSVTNHHTFPLLPVAGALPVVKTTTESIPTDCRTTNYSYANGFTHLQGKGFLGFEDIKIESSIGTIVEKHCELDTTFYVPVSSTTIQRNVHEDIMSRESNSMYIQRLGSSGSCSYETYSSGIYKEDPFNSFFTLEDAWDFDNGSPLYQSSNDGLVETEKEITYWESPIDSVYLKGLPQEIAITKTGVFATEGDDIYENITYERDPATGLVLKEIRSRNDLVVSTDGYSYNEYGQVTQHYTVAYNSTDTLVTRYEYDEKGQLKKEYNPKGQDRLYTYNSSYGTLTSIRDFDVLRTSYTYDGMFRETGRNTWVSSTKTARSSSKYGGSVYSITESGSGKTPVTTYYDAWERKVAESAPLADGTVMYTDYHYLPNGQFGFVSFPHKKNEPTQEGTTYTYDSFLRKTGAVDSNGKTSTWRYIPTGVVSCIDGVKKVTLYNAPDVVNCVADSLIKDWRGYETVAGGVAYYYYNVDEKLSSIDVGHTESGPDCEDLTTSFEYDDYGRLIQTTDANGVTKEYSYDVNGNPYRTTIDGSYVETNYDKYGILRSKSWADSGESPHTVTYTYDSRFRLTKEEGEDYSNTFKYDAYNRTTNKRNEVLCTPTKYVSTIYRYNSDNQLSSVSNSFGYSFLSVGENFSYTNGYQVADSLNNELVWKLTKQDRWGHMTEEKDHLGTTTHTYDDYGNVLSMNRSGSHPINESYTYDVHTGNLTNKNGTPLTYDDQNRLTGWSDYTYNYDRKGNITNQPFVGEFSYDGYRVDDMAAETNHIIDDSLRISYYKAIERPKSIENEHYKADFFYDGNGDRYMMKVYRKQSGQYNLSFTRYYLNANTELTEDSCGNETYMYYAGGDTYTAPAVIVKNYGANAATSIYQITRDNLGSVLLYENEAGAHYEFSYSPWGVKTHVGDETHFYLPGEDINCPFYRTYTGHEDLWMFGLLNANARLYSPYLGRFVSPDPLLNCEGGAWDYNPYVYANNNPYKYIDRNGEFPFLLSFALGLWSTLYSNFDNMNCAGDFFGVFGTYALSSALSYCVGSGVNVSMAGGSFSSGFVGNAHGVASTGFCSGFATGAASGFTSAFVSGAGTSWVNGSSFADGLLNGLKCGAINGIIEGAIGGIEGGLDALSKHANFFTGIGKFDPKGACSCSECWPSGLEIGESTITGKYVGQFEGVNVFETERLGDIYHAHKAVTVPERGIIAGKGVFTSGEKWGMAMMQHEFGHILQYRMYPAAYWQIVGIESGLSCSYASSVGDLSLHWNFWTEKWANYLSKGYFGKRWLGSKYPSKYPVGNISIWNKTRMSVSQMFNSIM